MRKSRKMRWVEQVARMGELKSGYRILVRGSKGKRYTRRWEEKAEMDFRFRFRFLGVDRFYLAEDKENWQAFVDTVTNFLAS
jgi:hypothetical protein